MDHQLSLHCSICLESFNSDNRAPVVLPCGHTFICMECSQRLDKCMVCREPLYLLSNSSGQKGEENSSLYERHRYQPRGLLSPQQRRRLGQYAPENVAPPQKKIRLPIPIPKNVVLMKLLESSQKTATVEEKRQIDYTNEEKEEEDLREGIRNFSGSCGTYVVRENKGLCILKHCGDSNMELYEEDRKEVGSSDKMEGIKNTPFDESDDDDDIDVFMMNCDGENMTDNIPPKLRLKHSSSDDLAHQKIKRLSVGSKIPTRLKNGQTVQITHFEDGIAKLARSAGYVRANPEQLVKIGCARDESCEIEGQLSLLTERRKILFQELDSMDDKISKLEKKLSETRAVPYPDAFAMLHTEEESEGVSGSGDNSADETQQRQASTSSKDLELPDLDQPSERHEVEGRPEFHRDFSDFPSPNLTDTYDSDDENYNDENDINSYASFLCYSGSPGSFGFSDSNTATAAATRMSSSSPIATAVAAASNNTSTRTGTPSSSPVVVTPASESIRRRGNYSQSMPSSPYQKSSGIDFRTGLSGHSALTASNSASRSYSWHYSPGRREIKSRGEHRGIGSIKLMPQNNNNRRSNHPNSPSAVSQISKNVMGFY